MAHSSSCGAVPVACRRYILHTFYLYATIFGSVLLNVLFQLLCFVLSVILFLGPSQILKSILIIIIVFMIQMKEMILIMSL